VSSGVGRMVRGGETGGQRQTELAGQLSNKTAQGKT